MQTMNHLVCGDSFQVLRDSIKDACVDLICLEGCRNHSLCIVDPVRAAPLAVGKRWIHAGSSPAKGSSTTARVAVKGLGALLMPPLSRAGLRHISRNRVQGAKPATVW